MNHRGHASPKKKPNSGKRLTSSLITFLRNEVFPSIIRKNSLSLSTSLVSLKPPSNFLEFSGRQNLSEQATSPTTSRKIHLPP
ncbi:hypothetical protein HID58_018741 [Brassica napus]|uniref:Uncharacterized protein n=1 Tax=Brassica napus TaxID=3708 RepID=A0ABQ8DDD1_BRANA|nr:hypothetical protein HID58_018741 [Brassica napus]